MKKIKQRLVALLVLALVLTSTNIQVPVINEQQEVKAATVGQTFSTNGVLVYKIIIYNILSIFNYFISL